MTPSELGTEAGKAGAQSKTQPMTDYQHLYDTAIVNPVHVPELKNDVAKIFAGQARYQAVASTMGNGIPFWFIGITHFMEAGAKSDPFLFHLHCGDPLTARTVHVPKGRPLFNPGNGPVPPSATNPYSWEESALDALKLMNYDHITAWGIPVALSLFERYNGMGYAHMGKLSPYLWSYTSNYHAGKYGADGKYDPNLVSKQPGTAALMKTLGV